MKKLLLLFYVSLFLRSLYGQPVIDASMTMLSPGPGPRINILRDNLDTNPQKVRKQWEDLAQRSEPLITVSENFSSLPNAQDISVRPGETRDGVIQEIRSYNDGPMCDKIYKGLVGNFEQQDNTTLAQTCTLARLVHAISQKSTTHSTINVVTDDVLTGPLLNKLEESGFRAAKITQPSEETLDISQALETPFDRQSWKENLDRERTKSNLFHQNKRYEDLG